MTITQLGNGGGFDTDVVSSSFLIEYDNIKILFDCGFNVIKKLEDMDVLDKITYVFISHLHDDHVSQLSTLIYKRYFIHGLQTKILCSDSIINDLRNHLRLCTTEMKHGQSVPANMFYLNNIINYLNIRTNSNKLIRVRSIDGYHGSTNSSGLLVTDLYYTSKLSVFISGDTKAFSNIESEINKIANGKVLIFHDFSHWNNPSRNIHACQSDIDSEYSKEFSSKFIYYHTNEEFNSEPINMHELNKELLYQPVRN